MSRKPLEEEFSWEEIYDKVIQRFPKLKNSRGFKDFFFKNKEVGYLFDANMIARLWKAYNSIHNEDQDSFFLIVGLEGRGKSTFAGQMASWIDSTFNHERFCFDIKEYVNSIKDSPKGTSVVLDEGGFALFSRQAMSSDSVGLIKLFQLQRQKNQFIVAICPDYWSIDAYIRRHRINTLIRIIEPGKYVGYVEEGIKIINEAGANKKLSLSQIRVRDGLFWHGYFRKKWPNNIDRTKYLDNKSRHLEEYLEDLSSNIQTKPTEQKMFLLREIAKEIGIQPKDVRYLVRKGTIKAEKIGERYFVTKEERERLLKESN